MMSRGIIFVVCASLILTIVICVKAQLDQEGLGSGNGSGSDMLSLSHEEYVAETTTVSVDYMLETTQVTVTVLAETTVMNSIVPSQTAAISYKSTSNAASTSSVLIYQSQPNTATPVQFVTSLLPEMMTTMVTIPSDVGSMLFVQKIKATTFVSTVALSTPLSANITPTMASMIMSKGVTTDSSDGLGTSDVSSPPSANIIPTMTSVIMSKGVTTDISDGLGTSDVSSPPSANITPTMASVTMSKGVTTDSSDELGISDVSSPPSANIIPTMTSVTMSKGVTTDSSDGLGTSDALSPLSVNIIPTMTSVTMMSEGDRSTTDSGGGLGTGDALPISSILFIVLGIVFFLIIVYLILICLLTRLLCKPSKGDYSAAKMNILSNWEVKDAPSRGGIQLMRIRTLDEEPENDNTLGGSTAQDEMGTRAVENDYETRNTRNATGITSGVIIGIEETVPTTAVTFGVATTEGTRVNLLETGGEIKVLSEAAATNPRKAEIDGSKHIFNDETEVGLEESKASGTACASALKQPTITKEYTTLADFEPVPTVDVTKMVDDENRDPVTTTATASAGSTDHKEMDKMLSTAGFERALFGGSSRYLEDATTEL